MNRSSGLGRGLGALIPMGGPGRSGLVTLRLSMIHPNPRQPRGDFGDAALEELAHSLREVGLLQPILVRPVGDQRYEIVAGERRFRAAGLAGLQEIPAIIRHTGDAALLTEALMENLHRADLNAVEEAAALQQLLDDFAITHEELARRLGKSRSAVSNALRLLTLPTDLQRAVVAGSLSAGHARALLGASDPELQQRLAQRVIAEGLSVRAAEELVRTAGAAGSQAMAQLAQAAQRRQATPYDHLQRRLTDALATRVRIRGTAKRGRIVIDYAGTDDLERLLQVLGRGTGQALANE
ncbi:MAG: ParB/RepB/Spo0J family partition protein [Actinomycetota bacterium]|nr:ParB/RepB/Spo0J family partition protein [Actinomycetota bacterium]